MNIPIDAIGKKCMEKLGDFNVNLKKEKKNPNILNKKIN
jgi:hypothetical protein